MNKIKEGDIVGRKSYGKDIYFTVKRIITTRESQIAILTGITKRVEADSDIEDLEKIEKKKIEQIIAKDKNELYNKIRKIKQDIRRKYNLVQQKEKRGKEKIITGKILHLDGDKKYSEKSYNYYKKAGLNAIVKNIPEYKQPQVIYNLLKTYKPDIVVITGHDSMLKKARDYNNIYNYRNSKYFIETVKEARRYDKDMQNKLVIFAGACQSYYEALIMAGANFASSPGRILIDFVDPIIVAETIAITEKYKYITIDDIVSELRDGKKGINGIGANGKMKIVTQL